MIFFSISRLSDFVIIDRRIDLKFTFYWKIWAAAADVRPLKEYDGKWEKISALSRKKARCCSTGTTPCFLNSGCARAHFILREHSQRESF
ncbi:hypothetical protein [Faecalispora sporosphaeroides]|uniref:hypothetical protein n=1 Tax=Faecalispora sporosphaeroides TaxID=1549 RepID=UPI0015A5F287|nr:hypothetical protein [Faecalispora sporosphaeroides]